MIINDCSFGKSGFIIFFQSTDEWKCKFFRAWNVGMFSNKPEMKPNKYHHSHSHSDFICKYGMQTWKPFSWNSTKEMFLMTAYPCYLWRQDEGKAKDTPNPS